MVGNEFSNTIELVQEFILPLMREHGIRYVQVGRGGPQRKDGVTLLDDSREPTVLHGGGDYPLSQEYLDSATGPQYSSRKCSIKAKGEILDRWLLTEWPHEHLIQAIGFTVEENTRYKRDSKFIDVRWTPKSPIRMTRQPFYPIAAWRWTREDCIDYIFEQTGVAWPKSCCSYCPFAGSQKGIGEHMARLNADPESALLALLVESDSRAFNPNQFLYGEKVGPLYENLEAAGYTDLIEEHEARLSALPWAVYHLRRYRKYKFNPNKPTKKYPQGSRTADNMRSLVGIERDITREESYALVGEIAAEHNVPVTETGRTLHAILRLDPAIPAPEPGLVLEILYLAAPDIVPDKQLNRFEEAWELAGGNEYVQPPLLASEVGPLVYAAPDFTRAEDIEDEHKVEDDEEGPVRTTAEEAPAVEASVDAMPVELPAAVDPYFIPTEDSDDAVIQDWLDAL